MIYEERRYKIVPGRMPAILRRFEQHTVSFFRRHGMCLVGFWTTVIGPSSNEITYILAFNDLAHREAAWKAFLSDQEWISLRAESEKDGMIVADVASRILAPTPFSPLQ
jgi:hypothetical protein